MNLGFAAIALVGMIALPVGHFAGDTPVVSDAQCSCAIGGDLLEITACGVNSPKASNISVTYSSDAQSGECDGDTPPCPVVGHCAGAVTITASSNAATGFADPPGTVNPGPTVGTFTDTFAVTGCGDYQETRKSIVVNPTVVSVCIVAFAAWCDSCSPE